MNDTAAVDPIGDRMKSAYEHPWRVVLPRRVPVIIRVDGKAFHTLTRKMDKPFDRHFMESMDQVTISLCEEIQGAQLAYVQSDEVSVLVHGYRTIQTQPWLNNEMQKMVSISASIATEAFRWEWPGQRTRFDSRVFLMPEDEVCNYFIWRQQDAVRNSIQMCAQEKFSQSRLHGLSCAELQELLFREGNVNWNNLPTRLKRGRCALRHVYERDGATRHQWIVDNEVPTFTQDRAYIERRVFIHREQGDAALGEKAAG